jgi:hypothetical protein
VRGHQGDRLAVLLWAYPKAYRRQRGEEILGTLRDAAPNPGTYETLRVCADVMAHGLRLRLGIASDQGGGRALAAAALPGMTMAAATAMVMPLFAQGLPGIRHSPTDFGVDTVVWPVLFAVWILGGLAALVVPTRRRLLAGACVTATVATRILVAPRLGWFHPDFELLVALSLPSLLAPRTSPRRSHRGFALLVGVLVLGVLVAAALRNPDVALGGPGFYWTLVTFAPWVAATVTVCAVILLAAGRRVHGSALALLAIPWLLFPTVALGPFGVATTTSVACLATACVIGGGLAGAWFSGRWKAHEALR